MGRLTLNVLLSFAQFEREVTGERIRYGGTFASFNNNLEETKFQIIDNLTRVYGNHTVKVGGNLLYTKILNRFMNFGSQNQGAGEFVFANLDDCAKRGSATYSEE